MRRNNLAVAGPLIDKSVLRPSNIKIKNYSGEKAYC
jgi:hypothetical protein